MTSADRSHMPDEDLAARLANGRCVGLQFAEIQKLLSACHTLVAVLFRTGMRLDEGMHLSRGMSSTGALHNARMSIPPDL